MQEGAFERCSRKTSDGQTVCMFSTSWCAGHVILQLGLRLEEVWPPVLSHRGRIDDLCSSFLLIIEWLRLAGIRSGSARQLAAGSLRFPSGAAQAPLAH